MVKKSWTVAVVRKVEEKAVREVGEMVKKMVEERVSMERALKKVKEERVGMEEVRKKVDAAMRKKVDAAMRKMEEWNKAEGDRMRAEEEKKMMEVELENLQTKNRSMFEELELLRAETEVYQTFVSPDHSQPSSQRLLHIERLTPLHTKLLSTRDKQEDDTGNGPASKRFRI